MASLTTRTLPQLFNGVSRQPAILRSQDQTESELNSWAAASAGVGKRPPTEHVASLGAAISDDAVIHIINRDATERYIVIIDDSAIRVFDFDGNEKTVSTPGGTAYLAGSDLVAVTVADYTFIVNRATKVLLKAPDDTTVPDYVRDPTRVPTYDETGTIYLGGRLKTGIDGSA